jgi:hypothetical protein
LQRIHQGPSWLHEFGSSKPTPPAAQEDAHLLKENRRSFNFKLLW